MAFTSLRMLISHTFCRGLCKIYSYRIGMNLYIVNIFADGLCPIVLGNYNLMLMLRVLQDLLSKTFC